jgi:hypothetical protein
MFWLLYADSLETSCHIIKYADDLTLTAETAEEQQQSINEVSAWCKTNNMTTNAEKSVILDLANKLSHHQQRNVAIRLEDEQIPSANHARFLGVIIDRHLTFKEHVDHIYHKVRPLTYILLNLKRSSIPPLHLITFYKLCLQPIITYACPAWYSMLSDELKKRITSLERLALKIIYPGLQSYEERATEAGVLPIQEVLEYKARTHIAKVKQKEHCLHALLPPTKSQLGRHSTRLEDLHIVRCRTALRRSSFIPHYCNI